MLTKFKLYENMKPFNNIKQMLDDHKKFIAHITEIAISKYKKTAEYVETISEDEYDELYNNSTNSDIPDIDCLNNLYLMDVHCVENSFHVQLSEGFENTNPDGQHDDDYKMFQIEITYDEYKDYHIFKEGERFGL